MKVRITAVTSISDGRGHRFRTGQVVEIDDGTAAGWINQGLAEPLDGPASTRPPTPVKRKRKD